MFFFGKLFLWGVFLSIKLLGFFLGKERGFHHEGWEVFVKNYMITFFLVSDNTISSDTAQKNRRRKNFTKEIRDNFPF